MSWRKYSAREVGALRRTAGPIHAAIDSGDMGMFARLTLSPNPEGGHQVTDKMALVLKVGYPADKSSKPDIWSVAERCLFRNRPEMLRVLLEARHPQMVNGLKTDSPAAWLKHLCSRYSWDQFASTSLAASADFNNVQHAVPFYKIVIEYTPDDDTLDQLSKPGTASAAHIMQARMEMEIDSKLGAVKSIDTASLAPNARSKRHV